MLKLLLFLNVAQLCFIIHFQFSTFGIFFFLYTFKLFFYLPDRKSVV